MKKQLQPLIARLISSQSILKTKRNVAELIRRLSNAPHKVSVFIRVDDPYSYLLLQVMPELEHRYDAQFEYFVVSHLQEHMFPEPDLWHKNALNDARHIADLYQLDFPTALTNRNEMLSVEACESATAQLIDLERNSEYLISALAILKAYWQGAIAKAALGSDALKQLECNDALLDKKGHYLSATLHYAGEWYWGVDRVSHLEKRLNHLGVYCGEALIKYDENTAHFCRRLNGLEHYPKRPLEPLIVYFSARSPYSYLGLERSVALARYYNIPVEIKPVLPMMMRGMHVPPRKKWYIFFDTKREALKHGLDYGYVADPLGVGVERCYALFDYATSEGKEVDYLLAFARAVNARAIHSDTDEGMKLIVEEAGLDWAKAKRLLNTNDWKSLVDEHYREMHTKGLWGVPCFDYRGLAVWGQDRIDVIERAICDAIKVAND